MLHNPLVFVYLRNCEATYFQFGNKGACRSIVGWMVGRFVGWLGWLAGCYDAHPLFFGFGYFTGKGSYVFVVVIHCRLSSIFARIFCALVCLLCFLGHDHLDNLWQLPALPPSSLPCHPCAWRVLLLNANCLSMARAFGISDIIF